MLTKFRTITLGAVAAIAFTTVGAGLSFAADIVGLITKTETNPFFVKMREGAQEKAKELGIELRTAAGKYDGDNDGQVAAIENLIAAGAKGFAIVPSDSTAIVPTIKKAREAGLKVIVLDTPLDPIDAADATFATDNFKAGQLIGQWAAKTLGDKAKSAKIVFLDLSPNQPTVDYLRDHGFMKGFGIEFKDLKHYGDETDPRVCTHEISQGDQEKGRTAMENALQKCPDVNLVYTINEPAAAGAWEALKGAGKADGSVLIVSIDGGCPGVKNDGHQQNDSGKPQEAHIPVKRLGIVVHDLTSEENLKIAEHVENQESEQNETGDCHDRFLADRGVVESRNCNRTHKLPLSLTLQTKHCI